MVPFAGSDHAITRRTILGASGGVIHPLEMLCLGGRCRYQPLLKMELICMDGWWRHLSLKNAFSVVGEKL